MSDIFDQSFHEIEPLTFYAILRLRIDVFVVEQNCPYPELDGFDIDSDTRHIWIADEESPVSYLRVLRENKEVNRIGRVATSLHNRHRGMAESLIEHVINTTSGELVLDAQAYLEDWYEGMGFITNGEAFEEGCGRDMNSGILHVPMVYKREID